jgi:hypothetical protein
LLVDFIGIVDHGLFLLVSNQVLFEDVVLGEELVAERALLLLLFRVDRNVLVEIRFLGEGVVAALERAHERSFAGVNSQMVKEIVPFPE